MKALVLFQATYLLCSMFILVNVSSAPFENEIRTRGDDEEEEGLPPIMPAMSELKERELPEREENSVRDEEENRENEERELAEENEREYEKFERPLNEENAEEFIKRLERELAMESGKRESHPVNEYGRKRSLVTRNYTEGNFLKKMSEEKDARELVEESEMEIFNRKAGKRA
ncbi:hypothetical protein OS493_003932 [Desmophyllum pertusum]|uniref:Uncharacterized protein n=1 Tax=Desmophyllum pertusum TaxID=174260 RepID=A0A9X0D4V9_9CNID|nr:hypothetical protein OS493_003932 [Desmophyllum pertusum]